MQPFFERRQYPRIEAAATALAATERAFFGSYFVENLSIGGALLRGDSKLSGEKKINILLQLPGRKPLGLIAEVVRHEKRKPGEHLFGVAFANPPLHAVKAIHSLVVSVLERTGFPPYILLATDCSETQKTLETGLGELGKRTVSASTPEEVAVRLKDIHAVFEAAIVDMSPGLEVLRLLEEKYPEIHRVFLASLASVEKARSQHSMIEAHAHAVLSNPWNQDRLKDVLSLHGVE